MHNIEYVWVIWELNQHIINQAILSLMETIELINYMHITMGQNGRWQLNKICVSMIVCLQWVTYTVIRIYNVRIDLPQI